MDNQIKQNMQKEFTPAMKRKGITQNKMAEMLNVSRSMISKYATGVDLPRLDKFAEICKILEWDKDEVFELLGLDNQEISKKSNTIMNSFNNNRGKIDFKG